MSSYISAAPEFLENYKLSIENKQYGEATKITSELPQLIEKHTNTTADNLRLFGIKLQEDKRLLESILIFDAASVLSKKIENPEAKLEMVQFCVKGMRDANQAMVGEDPDMKVVVKDYVIPLMRDKLQQMENTLSVSEQYKCIQIVWVLLCIEYSQALVDQLKESEQTLHEGLKRMDEVFGQNKITYRVYGTLFHNLGWASLVASHFREAVSFYKQAIDVFKAATDYGGDEWVKKLDIERSGRGLKIAQTLCQ